MSSSLNRLTLYEQITQKMQADILDHCRPGDMLESESKLALRYNVSVRTIREAVACFVHQGTLQRRAGRGTWVTEAKAGSGHIALIVGMDWMCPRPTYHCSRVLERTLDFFRRNQVAAKPYWFMREKEDLPLNIEDHELRRDLNERKITAIGIIQGIEPLNSFLEHCGVPSVWPVRSSYGKWKASIDQHEIIRRGVRLLIRQGCRRIAWIGWGGIDTEPENSDQKPNLVPNELYQTFSEALEMHGCEVREPWIKTALHPIWNGAGYEEFREIWTAFSEKPDGVLVLDDNFLPDMSIAMQEMNVMTDDIQIVAVGSNGGLSFPHFRATRLIVDPVDQAEALGKMLLELSKGKTPNPAQVTIPIYELEQKNHSRNLTL